MVKFHLVMADCEREKWVELYKKALFELEHAVMTGRIGDARTEISARIEKLRELPGLHAQEHQAIDDALANLRVLEQEEERLAEDEKRRVLEDALRKILCLAPKIREIE